MKIITSLTLTAGFLFLLAAGPAAIGTASENSIVSAQQSQASYGDELMLSATALRILRHTVQARADIHAKDAAHARDELKQAIMLLDIVQAMDPADRIRSYIWVAQKRLSYESNEVLIRDLTALYESVGSRTVPAEGNVVAAHIGKAKKLVEEGNRRGAGEELRLADEALVDTEIYLPVKYTKRHIEEAQAFLAKKELGKADAALKSAEDGIQFLSILDYMPAAQAAKSLSRAHKNYLALKFDAAREDLREGKSFLEKAARTADENTRTELAGLAKDIESLEARVGKWDQETSQEIRSLYLRAKSLVARATNALKTKRTGSKSQ